MVAMVVIFTSCQEQEYTLFFDDGTITLRTSADLSQNKIEAIQKEIEDVIANKAMTAKEIRKSVTAVMKDKTGTNNFSYSVDFGTGKTRIQISVQKPIAEVELVFFILGICAFCLAQSLLKYVHIE